MRRLEQAKKWLGLQPKAVWMLAANNALASDHFNKFSV